MKTRLVKVEGGFNTIRFHEEYANGKERRAACKGAKGRQPTGKARGFVLVDTRDPYHIQFFGSLTNKDPGEGPSSMASGEVGYQYLNSPRCRRVGACYMPRDWYRALMDTGWFKVIKGVLHDVIED